MRRIAIIRRIAEEKIIAVIRAENKENGLKLFEAIHNGGIRMLEITMTVPNAIEIIAMLSELYKDEDVLIGSGTVLDPETARSCILAGADFIVSPSLNLDTVKLCNRYRVPIIPGIMTIRDAIEAIETGVEIVKLFPGNAYSPDIIKAFKGPIPHGNFMPTGGVSISNLKDWLEAGAVAVGIGGELTKGAQNGNYKVVTETAIKYVNLIRDFNSAEI
jgi:2-dehydro-3-deoxyphosphogluconate aldolase / (4S)-4-hydroxy-2-oxoglutarate aldolase